MTKPSSLTAPTVLGINRTQDASLCLLHGSELLCAIQKERLTRRKHHWGKLHDFRDYYQPVLSRYAQPIAAVVECYSSDREYENLEAYAEELNEYLKFTDDCQRTIISHHLAHLYSVFYPAPFEEAAVMVIDGQGSPVIQMTETWSERDQVPGHYREVSSFYHVSRNNGVDCLAKQLWDCDDQHLVGLGMFYFLLTQAIFPGEGNEGKVMGLAPHGNPQALGLPALEVDGPQVRIPDRWREILRERKRFHYLPNETARFQDSANLAAAGQRVFEDVLLHAARWLHERTHAEALCFAGSTALNCSANDRLLRESSFQRIFIPPAPSDAGTALGCAVYGLQQLMGFDCEYRWEQDFLGPKPAEADIDRALPTTDDMIRETPTDMITRMTDLLCEGKVVALYQGRSEFGPRALGHRSILADPRRAELRDWINAEVKEREWFRPLAPVVLLEEARHFFAIERPSPFMQFAAPVLPEAAARIPAVTHVDCTARLQTVGPRDDPFLRKLLQAFAARTGVPVLLNTSFNRKEEPIVESPSEAVASFRRTPIDALAMPPYLLIKRTAGQ